MKYNIYTVTNTIIVEGFGMTIQQEAENLIHSLSDDNVRLMVSLMSQLTDLPSVSQKAKDTSMRFGAGKGIITDVPNFDDMDSEIEKLFTGATL